MAIRFLYGIFGLLLLAGGVSCQRHSKLDELMEENPFQTDFQPPAKDVVIVSCEYYPVKLPAGVDVSSFASWPGGKEKAEEGSAGYFSAEQVKLWRENGIEAAAAPVGQWGLLRDEIVKAGGVCLTQMRSYFHSINDVADYPTFWNGQERPLFVTQGDGSLQGYTLPEGDCLFAVQCRPWENRMYSEQVEVTVVPVFQGADRQEKFVRDEVGEFKLIRENARIPLAGMELRAVLPRGHFLCLAASPAKEISNPGDFFLRGHAETTQDSQFVVILVPSMETADELKARMSNEEREQH